MSVENAEVTSNGNSVSSLVISVEFREKIVIEISRWKKRSNDDFQCRIRRKF